MFHTVLTQDAESIEGLGEDEKVMNDEEKEQRRSSSEAFLKITVLFLQRMKHGELADSLKKSKKLSALHDPSVEFTLCSLMAFFVCSNRGRCTHLPAQSQI